MFCTTENNQRLEDLALASFYAEYVISIVSECIVTFTTYFLLIHLLCKQKSFKEIPLRVKINLIGWAIYLPIMTANEVVNLVKYL